ncbi:hypothetical protein BKA81DRAFT_123915 [Phyllosticta paracitricarpa]
MMMEIELDLGRYGTEACKHTCLFSFCRCSDRNSTARHDLHTAHCAIPPSQPTRSLPTTPSLRSTRSIPTPNRRITLRIQQQQSGPTPHPQSTRGRRHSDASRPVSHACKPLASCKPWPRQSGFGGRTRGEPGEVDGGWKMEDRCVVGDRRRRVGG